MNVRASLFILVVLSAFFFAAPLNLSITIDNNATYTGSTLVILSLYAENATNCTYANAGENYTVWDGYATTKTWTIPATDGMKTVSYKCMDANGSESTTVSDSIILDQSAPLIGLAQPGAWAGSTTPLIKIAMNDSGSGVNASTIVFGLDGEVRNASLDNSTGYLTYTPAAALNLTQHTLTISVRDNFGRDASGGWSFGIDAVPPYIHSPSPLNGSFLKTATPTIYAILKDNESGLNATVLTFTLDGNSVAGHATFNNESGVFSHVPGTSLSDGTHTAVITAIDLAGNSQTMSWNFGIDRNPPTISGRFPAKDGKYATSIRNLTATLQDSASGVNKSDISILIDSSTYKGETYNQENGYLMLPLAIELSAGVHKIELITTDNVGNSLYDAWSFTLDLKGPEFSQLSPSENSYTNNSRITISADMKDGGTTGLNLSTLALLVDGIDRTGSATVTSGRVSYTPTSQFSDGQHSVSITVSNNEGRQAGRSWLFTIDTGMPASPRDFSAVTGKSNVRLSWTKSSSADVADYLVYGAPESDFKQLALLTAVNSLNSTYLHQFSGKKMYFALSARDAAGNEGNKLFTGTCGAIVYGVWNDYGCCDDKDCGGNSTCEVTTHQCLSTVKDIPNQTVQNQTTNLTILGAELALNATRDAIRLAKNQGKSTVDAEGILAQAESAYNAGNYAQAKYLAEYALNKANSAQITIAAPAATTATPAKKGGCCGSLFVILAMVSSLFLIRDGM